MDALAVLDEDRPGRQCPFPKSIRCLACQSRREVGEGVSMEDIFSETAWKATMTELHFLNDVSPFLYPPDARIVDRRESELGVWR
jgi:CRISPR/Cas system-associated protein Cas7 (RAMP superfamily)